MKTFLRACALTVLAGVSMFAADITGKWKAEQKMERNGETMTMQVTMDLKAEGNTLTGTVLREMVGGGGQWQPRPAEIKDGKIEGNKATFKTTSTSPRGEMTWSYEVTLTGESLAVKQTREGGEGRTSEFTATRVKPT